jgi:SWI/SNF-related matrix-associated actin-dependent regulator 1 of chromatin subfamily A
MPPHALHARASDVVQPAVDAVTAAAAAAVSEGAEARAMAFAVLGSALGHLSAPAPSAAAHAAYAGAHGGPPPLTQQQQQQRSSELAAAATAAAAALGYHSPAPAAYLAECAARLASLDEQAALALQLAAQVEARCRTLQAQSAEFARVVAQHRAREEAAAAALSAAWAAPHAAAHAAAAHAAAHAFAAAAAAAAATAAATAPAPAHSIDSCGASREEVRVLTDDGGGLAEDSDADSVACAGRAGDAAVCMDTDRAGALLGSCGGDA